MTRRHFERLAWELRQSHPWERPGIDLAADLTHAKEVQWETDVRNIANACAESNPAFDRGRFYRAAGLDRRPDGSMFPMAAPR